MKYGEPSEDDLANGGRRVEVYNCGNNSCDGKGKFVRYQYPEKLFETREGRCGEWAHCFAGLLDVGLGMEVRKVLDWTDHVWMEVWLPEVRKWVHVDCCEDVVDEPLLYEKGWGKRLNYVIAVGRLGIVDVSRFYVMKWEETLGRRKEIDEKELKGAIEKLNEEILEDLNEESRNVAVGIGRLMPGNRFDPEGLVDSGRNLGGRTSGSADWIAARGEQGTKTPQN